MPSRNTHVRVTPETRDQLDELLESIEESVSLGRGVRFWRSEVLTRAELIAELVRRELAHRRRSKDSAARRRKGKEKGQGEAGKASEGEGGTTRGIPPDQPVPLEPVEQLGHSEFIEAMENVWKQHS